MRKRGKFLFLLLLVMLLIATLAACNLEEGTQGGGGTPGGDDTPGGDVTPGGDDTPGGNETPAPTPFEPVEVALVFNVMKGGSALDKAVVGEFDLATDVVAYIYLQTAAETFVRGPEVPLTEDMIVAEDRAKLQTAYDGPIRVEYKREGKETLTGVFQIHLKEASAPSATIMIALGEGAKMEGGGATLQPPSEDPEVTLVNVYAISEKVGQTLDFSYFVSNYKVFAPSGYALSHYTYGDAESPQVFDASTPLVVSEGMTLTAVYTQTFVTVVFDLNAEDDCWAEDSAPNPPASVDVALTATVPAPVSQLYASEKYDLLGWATDADGETLWNFNTRVAAQTEERGTITLYAVWGLKSARVSFDFGGGTFVTSLDGLTLTATDGLDQATALVTYGEDGRVDGFSLSGIDYGTSLEDYYVTFALTSGGEDVDIALADLASVITKGSIYKCAGMWLDAAHTEDNALGAEISGNETVYVGWSLESSLVGDDYYEETYNFILKPDNTYAISVKNRAAEVLYIPASYDGRPVTEIAAEGGSNLSSVTTVDLSNATNLVRIGNSAFWSCTSLVDVHGGDALTSLEYVGKDAFYGTAWFNAAATSDEDLVLGDVLVRYRAGGADLGDSGYKYIASGAFADFNLDSVILPDALIGIEDQAFAGSALAGGVTAEGGKIEYIGAEAFAGAVFVNNVAQPVIIGNVLYRVPSAATSVNVPAGVTVIADQACAACRSLATVTFEDEDGIVSVGKHAFRGTPYAQNDADGFVVIGGVLAGYYGSATTIVIPDEVTVIAPYAIPAGVQNVVFRTTSSLEKISNYAFAAASSLGKIAIYKNGLSVDELETEPYAFANANGNALANTVFSLYLGADVIVGIGDDGPLAYLNDQSRVTASTSTPVIALNTSVFVTDYVASDDGSFAPEDFATAWNAVILGEEGAQYVLIPDGIAVTRDGMTVNEDYTVTVAVMEASLNSANFPADSQQIANGILPVSYAGVKINFAYVLHAAIDETSFELDDSYRYDGEGDSRRLVFYTSQSAFDTSGTMLYEYKPFSFGDKQSDATLANEEPSVALNSANVKVSGYSYTIGERVLTVKYSYYGKEYTASLDYVVREPKVERLQQTSTAVLPLGVSATAYHSSFKFDAIYSDGSVVARTLSNATIMSVDGAPATSLVTDEPGMHTAVISYNAGSGSIPVEGVLIYSVELVPVYTDYTVEPNLDASGAEDGTATITAVAGNREIYVLPETVTIGEKDYTVTAIGANAFKNKTALTTVYLPRPITVIGEGAFYGCTALKDIYGFDYDSDAVNSPAIDFTDASISSEYREATVTVEIVGINDGVLNEDTVTFPSTVSYVGSMEKDQLDPAVQTLYVDGAEITVDYTMTFTMSAGTVDVILADLINARYDGTVRIPVDADGNVFAAYQELYDALGAVETLTVETYDGTQSLGMSVLIGGIELGADADAEVAYTSRYGEVIVTGEASATNNIVYIPATLTGTFDADGNYAADGAVTGEYTVTGLGANVFNKVGNAAAIYIPDSIISLAGDSIDDVFGSTVEAPSAQIYMYSDNNLLRPHSSGSTIEPFPASVKEIGKDAFRDCASLTVEFSSATALESIGANAFMGCDGISSFILGEGSALKEIGAAAFAESGVTTVDLSGSALEDLGNASVFEGCALLSTLVLPDTVTQIGANAFKNCYGLTSVTVEGDGAAIRFIGEFAFHNCAFDPDSVTEHCAPDCETKSNAFANCHARQE